MRVFCACRNPVKATKIECPLQSTVVISIAFFFVFSAFMSIQALQNSLNMEAGLGVKSLACLYSTSVVSSLLAPTFIKVFGGKPTVVGAFICHAIYTLSNFYPHFYTLIPASLLLGIATGPLWTAQNLYITASATRIAEKHSKELIHVMNKHNGIFFSVIGIAFASGGIVSSVIFRHAIKIEPDNVTQICGAHQDTFAISKNLSDVPTLDVKPNIELIYQLFSVYLGFDIIGLTITILLLPTLPLSDWLKNKSVLKSVYSMFSSLSNGKLVMFLPMPAAIAVQRFVLYTDFTRAYVTCPFGVGMVGFVMASYAVSNTIFLQIVPRVAKYVKRHILLAIATISNVVEMILWLFWMPSVEQLWMVFVSVIIWGFTDSIWRLEIFGIVPVMFPDKKEPAFANVHFWRGLLATVYFASASYLSVFIKLVICIGLLFTSMVLYSILGIITVRDQRKDRTELVISIEEKTELQQG